MVTHPRSTSPRRLPARDSIAFPAELPVSACVAELSAAIEANQVVIVAGETGSGKSTQLPKICLALGRGAEKLVGHTQPRRIAARTLAERIADELGVAVGDLVGYAIRFGDHTSPATAVKLMTDGILLAEIATDPLLTRYDTIIIDEAHERSLNIDFLLGYLARLLPKRPDLKVVITSATIDPERFAAHFGGAPIIEVSGRTYPVEIRYRPYRSVEDVGDEGDYDDSFDNDGSDDGSSGGGGSGGSSSNGGAWVGSGSSGGASGGSGSRGSASGGRPDATVDRRSGARRHPPSRNRPRATEIDQATAICRAVDELFAVGDGDILVFLSGEREINDTVDALRAHLQRRGGLAAATDILPLYGRLSMADQHRVFAPSGRRRIVLATNVAETSLTVPGIRYVIDPGTARISRYSTRTKVQRLPIEPISQASANQRSGRCGRVADGIAIRLYSEDDFRARDEFTDPEIARTSLAAVILRMAALGLGDIETFPFLDPPETKQIADGIGVLTELGAIERGGAKSFSRRSRRRRGNPAALRLTPVGRDIAKIPVDPRLARVVVEAARRGCTDEILTIVAALAIRDVREYPLDERDKATAAHARFKDPSSDFLGLLRLWDYLTERSTALSGNAFRRLCKAEYLHYLRFREWQDLRAQLARSLPQSGHPHSAPGKGSGRGSANASDPAPGKGSGHRAGVATSARSSKGLLSGGEGSLPKEGSHPGEGGHAGEGSIPGELARDIHTCLAAGFLAQIGVRMERATPRRPAGRTDSPGKRTPPGPRLYQGTRGTSFALWPGSSLAKSGADYVLAAELVETSRLWARTVAAVDPAWIEEVGGDLLRRNYSQPHWSTKRQAVIASETVTLLGVTLVSGRPVQYDRIDPEQAREIFIRSGLVDGQWRTHLPFLAANQDALDEVIESERRSRRGDIAVDDEALVALYDERLPASVTSGRHLESWWRTESRTHPELLTFTPDMLVAAGASLASHEEFPDRLETDGVDLELSYVFEPGAANDGVSATIPVAALASIDPGALPANVPGHRRELTLALIRSLPKSLRTRFVPAPDVADAALRELDSASGPLPDRLATVLTRISGTPVTSADFDLDKVPDHLRMTFTVVSSDGTALATGKDLPALAAQLHAHTRQAVAQLAPSLERTGMTTFPTEGIPPRTTATVAGQQVTGYPALVAEDDGAVGIRVLTDEPDQRRAMRAGLRRLVAIAAADVIAASVKQLKRAAGARGPVPAGAAAPFSRADIVILATSPDGETSALVADAADAAIDALLDWAGAPVWTQSDFDRMQHKIAGQLPRAVTDILRAVVTVLRAAAGAEHAISQAERALSADRGTIAALRRESRSWLHPGFVTAIGAAHLPDVTRYLQALETRAERLVANPDKDAARAAEIADLDRAVRTRIDALRPERTADPDVAALRRLIAEYRIALFAQPMKTAVPVSAKRIRAALAALPD